MKEKIQTEKADRLFLICTECQKKIVGVSESQLLHNLRVHAMTHEKDTAQKPNKASGEDKNGK